MLGDTGTPSKKVGFKHWNGTKAIRSTDLTEALDGIIDELFSATAHHPEWVTDPIHAAGLVVEEAGELMQAALDHTYPNNNHKEGDTLDRMKKEAIQTGAMALRFLIHLQDYETQNEKKGGGHENLKPETGFWERLKRFFNSTFT